jgi:methanethiol S-methyltransferase
MLVSGLCNPVFVIDRGVRSRLRTQPSSHCFSSQKKKMSKLLLSSTIATSTRSIGPMFLVALSNLFFIGSMLMWMIFLWNGALNVVRLDGRITSSYNEVAKLGFDCVLSMAFFIQHSTMIRRPFRRVLAKFIVAAEYHGVIFTNTSAVMLSMVVLFWQKSAYIIANPSNVFVRLLMRAMFVLAIQGFRWAADSLKSFDLLGVDPILRKIGKKEPPPPMPLSMSGPYRYVRHPFYLFCLVLFWACPKLTLDRLLYNVLWSVWVVIGTLLEERDLVMDFGEPYREYQREVPMLIPWFIKPEKTKAKQNALKKKSG